MWFAVKLNFLAFARLGLRSRTPVVRLTSCRPPKSSFSLTTTNHKA